MWWEIVLWVLIMFVFFNVAFAIFFITRHFFGEEKLLKLLEKYKKLNLILKQRSWERERERIEERTCEETEKQNTHPSTMPKGLHIYHTQFLNERMEFLRRVNEHFERHMQESPLMPTEEQDQPILVQHDLLRGERIQGHNGTIRIVHGEPLQEKPKAYPLKIEKQNKKETIRNVVEFRKRQMK